MSHSACPAPAVAPVIPLFRPWPQRQWADLGAAWSAWRERARRRAEWRALERLDRHVLRDLGLADRVPERPQERWVDLERAPW